MTDGLTVGQAAAFVGATVKTMAEALISAEADSLCGVRV